MKIPIPMTLVRAWAVLGDWGNTPVTFRYDIRRLDLIMGALFAFCIGWYGWSYGWMGALQGGVMFVTIGALALFMRRG